MEGIRGVEGWMMRKRRDRNNIKISTGPILTLMRKIITI